jgi:hypothetical protein
MLCSRARLSSAMTWVQIEAFDRLAYAHATARQSGRGLSSAVRSGPRGVTSHVCAPCRPAPAGTQREPGHRAECGQAEDRRHGDNGDLEGELGGVHDSMSRGSNNGGGQDHDDGFGASAVVGAVGAWMGYGFLSRLPGGPGGVRTGVPVAMCPAAGVRGSRPAGAASRAAASRFRFLVFAPGRSGVAPADLGPVQHRVKDLLHPPRRGAGCGRDLAACALAAWFAEGSTFDG